MWLVEGGLTGEVGLGAVGAQVLAIGVGGVALELALISGLQLGDMQQGGILAQALHVDLLAVDTLGVDGVGVVGLAGADDADLPFRGRGQVHGPLKVLLYSLLVACHIAPDGDMGALGTHQWATLHGHHPFA